MTENNTIKKRTRNSKSEEYRVGDSDSQVYQMYFPDGWGKDSKLLVCIHGISRRYKQQIRLLMKYASKNDTVLVAPYFSDRHYHSFQRHDVGSDGLRSDQVLDNILNDISNRHDINANKFDLFGFSAGAQFAHRYAYRNPDKIARLTICAAGWYTLPKFSKQYPYGLAPNKTDTSKFEITEQQLCDFLRIPLTISVGEFDKRTDSSLNRSKIINTSQGYDRVERAINWTREVIMAAQDRQIESKIKFVFIPRSGHSFTECINYGTLPRYLFDNN